MLTFALCVYTCAVSTNFVVMFMLASAVGVPVVLANSVV